MKGYIYCIKSPNTDEIYIGSTTQTLHRRFYLHKWEYENKKGYISTSKIIFDYGDAYIEMMEEMEFDDINELRKKEGEYQSTMKCVNRKIECNYREQYCKEYRENNREKKREYDKKYRENNREKRNEYNREWCANNIERKRELRRKSYLKNIDKIIMKRKETFLCECGSNVRKSDKAQHFRTKKHQSYEKNNSGI